MAGLHLESGAKKIPEGTTPNAHWGAYIDYHFHAIYLDDEVTAVP